jgi:hypothetical protein
VAGCTVYRNSTPLGTTGSGTTSYIDVTVAPSTNHTCTVGAFDAAGHHSAQSAQLLGTEALTPQVQLPAGFSFPAPMSQNCR